MLATTVNKRENCGDATGLSTKNLAFKCSTPVFSITARLFHNCPQKTVRKKLSTKNCPQETVHKKLSARNCPQETVRKKLSTRNCPQKTVRKKLSARNCLQKTVRLSVSVFFNIPVLSVIFKIASNPTKSFLAIPVSKHSTGTDEGNRLLILFWKCMLCSYKREKNKEDCNNTQH